VFEDANNILALISVEVFGKSTCDSILNSFHSDDPIVKEKAMTNTLKQKKLILSELK
jgi:hypothetical protein